MNREEQVRDMLEVIKESTTRTETLTKDLTAEINVGHLLIEELEKQVKS